MAGSSVVGPCHAVYATGERPGRAYAYPRAVGEQAGHGGSDEQTYVTAFGQSSASEVLAMAVKAGQGWLMTEGKLKPVFVRLPWLSSRFMDSIDSYIDRKQKEEQTVTPSGGLLIVEDKGQLMP